MRGIIVRPNTSGGALPSDDVPSPTHEEKHRELNNPAAQRCRNIMIVTANVRRLLREYSRSNQLEQSAIDRARSLAASASALIQEIREKMQAQSLQDPSVYRDRLNAIERAYMALPNSRPSSPE